MDSPRPAGRRGSPPRSRGITANTPAAEFPLRNLQPEQKIPEGARPGNRHPHSPDGQILHLASEHETAFAHFNAGDLPNGSSRGYAKLAPQSRSSVNRRATGTPSASNRPGSKRSPPSRRVNPPSNPTGTRAPRTSASDL